MNRILNWVWIHTTLNIQINLNSGYGLCSKVVIRQNEIVFSVKHKYEDDITSITVSYKDNAIEDIKEYRKMLSNIFGDILIIE